MNKPGLNRGSIQHFQNWRDFGEKRIQVGNQHCLSNSAELSQRFASEFRAASE
jgi:hypothetical protein